MARRIDFGSSDGITLAAGALADSTRAGTVVALVKRASTFNTNFAIIAGAASGTVVWELLVSGGAPFGSGDFGTGGPAITQDTWTVIAATKPSGSHVYRYHTAQVNGTWTHQDGTFSADDGSGGTDSIQVGVGSTTRNLDIAAAARWTSDVLSDEEIEALGTTSMAGWLAGDPDAAWQFNQGDTSDDIIDLTGGGADQTAISGTSVVDDPAGWTYFTAAETDEGTLAATLPALTGAISLGASATATLAGTLPALTADLDGTAAADAQLSGLLPALTGVVAGDGSATAALAATLPALSGLLAGNASATATLAGTLPALVGLFAETPTAATPARGTVTLRSTTSRLRLRTTTSGVRVL